ncbi:FAD-dependent oxidoreductase [Roseomonas sp. NAR14]|uniref:Tryptophan 2-monooxygenase n=1 Tax=Roseomonas acroporae TaxID=2937791 RepID=A0A9X1YCN0_9PROT|nr:FAD-dependent oxidoreductase [Roseomonas acroporae]
MREAGFDVAVLEARDRPGGRCRTWRAGDTVEEDDGTVQRVVWPAAPHLYANPGPARIPHHHRALLGWCRRLGVALEPLVNENRAALLQADAAFGGAPQTLRRVRADLRGVVAELAAKALDRQALDAPVSPADLEALRDLLRTFGALDRDLRWSGSARAGWAVPPGAGDAPGARLPPLDLAALLRSRFWYGSEFAEGIDYAATMLQPVGGMDAIATALARPLGDAVTYGAEVLRLRRDGPPGAGGARAEWRDRAGAVHAARADHLLVTLPAPVLARLDADFDPARREALAAVEYAPAAKLAFHAARRFWEEDHAIYGGISWTGRDATQLWYPSHGFGAPGGILIGAYIWGGPPAGRFAARSPAERAAAVAADGERLHPGYGGAVSLPVSIPWGRVPHALGAWAEYTGAQRRDLYPLLCAAEPPYHFAGEHLSWLPGWQEGAVLSAEAAAAAIGAEARARRG